MTKNFRLIEFTDSTTAKRLGINNTFTDDVIDLKIKALVINVLQPLRDALGHVKINSGYRCPVLNKAVGGAVNSRHMKGTAADITLGSISKNKEAFEWIKKNCEFRQLIWEKGGQWIHVEYDQNDNKKQVLNIK